jgi:hypothetical protein
MPFTFYFRNGTQTLSEDDRRKFSIQHTGFRLNDGTLVYSTWNTDFLSFARENQGFGIRRVTSVEQLVHKEKKTVECSRSLLRANGGEVPILFRSNRGLLCTNGGEVHIKYRGQVFSTPSGWAKSITGLSNSGWDNCRIGQDDVPEAEWPTLNEWYAEYIRVHPPTERPCKKGRTAWRDDDKAAGVVAFLPPDQEQKWIDERLAEIEDERKRKRKRKRKRM